MIKRRFHRRRLGDRRAAAVVELAVCLPVMVVLIVGAIESTSMTFLQNSLQVIAYESIRTAVRQDATAVAVQARAQQVIQDRKVHGASVTISPTNLDALDAGTPVTVTVTAPAASNRILPLQFFGGEMSAQATMIKE